MKIGIFGGCFNPPHNMHKGIAENLIQNGYLDKVIFVPTGNSYNKKDLIGINERICMLELMVKRNDIEVSDICKDNNYQWTYQVLDYFKNKYSNSNIYFICGTDNLREFETWQKYEYILSRYKLLVIKRNDDNVDELINKYEEYKQNIQIANIKQCFVSSTIIRERIKAGNYDCLIDNIDKNILKYIKEKRLYKD